MPTPPRDWRSVMTRNRGKRRMTMKQAQAECRKLKAKGDRASLARAERLEAKFRDQSDYESDRAWLLRKQAGY